MSKTHTHGQGIVTESPVMQALALLTERLYPNSQSLILNRHLLLSL